jgi:ParB family transcriptional regulator, chromosome partitioning protein
MALGKNLENILGDYFGDQGIDLNTTSTQVIEIDISKIERNPHQTRKQFEEGTIAALAENIDKNGLINPITIIKDETGNYVLLAGERRLRAFQHLAKKKIPAIIKDVKKLNEKDKFLISASENLQRQDLNAIELAKTFRILMDNNQLSLKAMGNSIGSSPQYVLNYLNLLELSSEVQSAIEKGIIGESHGRRLTPLPHHKQDELLKVIIEQKMSKRELEDLVKKLLGKKEFKPQAVAASWINKIPTKKYSEIEAWTKQFPKSKIKAKGDENKGKIVITWGGYSE